MWKNNHPYFYFYSSHLITGQTPFTDPLTLCPVIYITSLIAYSEDVLYIIRNRASGKRINGHIIQAIQPIRYTRAIVNMIINDIVNDPRIGGRP
jgi:hypothetical protein